MTDVPPLLNSDDLASFNASDPDWFLAAAGETVRWSICQWHIAPTITETRWCPIQPDGTIMLPTLYLTDVQSVSIDGVELDPTTYHMHEAGYIRWHRPYVTTSAGLLWPMENDQPFREYPSPVNRHAEVTFTHGYTDLPAPVKAVALELATRAMEQPSGAATELAAGPNTIKFGPLGIVPTDEQRRRLGPYTLVRF